MAEIGLALMRNLRTLVVFFTLLGVLASCSDQPGKDTSILRFAKLIDGTGKALSGHEIAISEGVITAIGDDLRNQYPAAEIVDLGNLVALPGLIDAHVHITYALAEMPQGDAWAELGETSAADRLKAAAENARQTLESGVTSARDLYSSEGTGYALKEQIEQGAISGPRLFLSGAGFHPQALLPLAEGEERDIVAEFSQATRQRIAMGADWIKIFASTGSASDLTGEQVFFYPEIKAVVDIAHAAGVRVALHTYGPGAVPDALRAGVDSIEHPVGLTGEILEEWAASGTIYVPTIDHNRYYADHRAEYGYDDKIERGLREFVQANVETVRHAHSVGIRIAMGSDAVMTMFGQNTQELEWFVEAGMTPGEAIQSATINGAILLGQEELLGRLAPGFAADIIAVKGDPLSNIHALTDNVIWVMKGGEVVVKKDQGTAEEQ